MTKSHFGRIAAAAALGLFLAFAPTAGPAQAQVNPTASAVKEEQLLRELDKVTGRATIPDAKAATLIRPDGQEFRRLQRDLLPWVSAIAILGMIGVIAAFFFYRGRIRIDAGPSGYTIQRFGGLDRFTHWLTAISFLVLAITGLNTAFGRSLLIPLIGEGAFASWAQTAKYVHNYTAFPFMLGMALMFVLWVKDNIFSAYDVEWLRRFGGLASHDHPPSERFNFGQKTMFWSVILLGAAMSATGLLMLFPFVYADVQGMQYATLAHGMIGAVFFAATLAHIYIGTLGMEGAVEAMANGRVDVNWAKEHHSVWAEEELKRQTPQPVAGGAGRAVPAE
ncbi:MAG: formate dehydrogenase subunit gamma [Methylobacteriaceae bacterium]|nr:formate dehydrogenase subunit gamma [Methylobacteriaceae bacterium]